MKLAKVNEGSVLVELTAADLQMLRYMGYAVEQYVPGTGVAPAMMMALMGAWQQLCSGGVEVELEEAIRTPALVFQVQVQEKRQKHPTRQT